MVKFKWGSPPQVLDKLERKWTNGWVMEFPSCKVRNVRSWWNLLIRWLWQMKLFC